MDRALSYLVCTLNILFPVSYFLFPMSWLLSPCLVLTRLDPSRLFSALPSQRPLQPCPHSPRTFSAAQFHFATFGLPSYKVQPLLRPGLLCPALPVFVPSGVASRVDIMGPPVR